MTTHDPHPTRRQMGTHLRYSGKSWSDSFVCPVCGIERRFNLNFLGNRRVPLCDGQKIVAGPVLSLHDYQAALKRAGSPKVDPNE